MKNYIKNAVHILMVGLFLLNGVACAQDALSLDQVDNTPLIDDQIDQPRVVSEPESNEVALAVQEAAHVDKIRITSTKYELGGAIIDAMPCPYAIKANQNIYFGAPEVGYNSAALTKLTTNGDFVSIAYKKVFMNKAVDQLNPLYNQKVQHISVGYNDTLYVVIESKPDTIYRYSGFDKLGGAIIHVHKIMPVDGKQGKILRLASGIIEGVEYVVAQVASNSAEHNDSFVFIKSYNKVIPPKKVEKKTEAVTNDTDADDAKEEKKTKENKPRAKYLFVGIDPLTGAEAVSKSISLEALLPEALKQFGVYTVTDMQITNGSLFLEVQNPFQKEQHAILMGKVVQNKCMLSALRKDLMYYKGPFEPISAWQQEPGLFIFTLNNAKKYCITVGGAQRVQNLSSFVLAIPMEKDDQSAPFTVGSGALPGPVTDMQAIGETIYAAVAACHTQELPGIFCSQAIINEKGAIAAWSPWQRTAGSTDPVIGMFMHGSTFHKLSLCAEHKDRLRFHGFAWRGPSIAKENEVLEAKAAAEIAKRQAQVKRNEEQKEKAKKEALKKAADSGVPAEPVVQKNSKKEEKPDFNCVLNTGYALGYGHTSHYASSAQFLSYLLTTQFDSNLGGVKVLCDVPATRNCASSYLIAAGHQQLLIAQTNPVYDAHGNNLIRDHHVMLRCEDGTLNACAQVDPKPDVMLCKGGALDELGFIDVMHIATDGKDQWLCIGGPRGVALLQTNDGHGIATATGFGNAFASLNPELAFTMFGSYEWVRKIMSDDQFLYIVTEDRIDRIPLHKDSFKKNGQQKDVCTLATAETIGAVCEGYVFNDACIVQGILFVATPRGLVATAPGVDYHAALHQDQITWQRIDLPSASANISALVAVSSTVNIYDAAGVGQLYVVACSLFDETASVNRLFIDRSLPEPVVLVPDVKKKYCGSWINHAHRINTFYTDGALHLVARARFEDKGVELARVPAAGIKRNPGTSQLTFNEQTRQVNSIIRSTGTGTLFVTADDGVRIYE
ncbi:MAG: hypothetical protein AB7F19_03010 [Candidatus Babeliales bacterium]